MPALMTVHNSCTPEAVIDLEGLLNQSQKSLLWSAIQSPYSRKLYCFYISVGGALETYKFYLLPDKWSLLTFEVSKESNPALLVEHFQFGRNCCPTMSKRECFAKKPGHTLYGSFHTQPSEWANPQWEPANGFNDSDRIQGKENEWGVTT